FLCGSKLTTCLASNPPERRPRQEDLLPRHASSSTFPDLRALPFYRESLQLPGAASSLAASLQQILRETAPREAPHLPSFESAAARVHRPDRQLRPSRRARAIFPANRQRHPYRHADRL